MENQEKKESEFGWCGFEFLQQLGGLPPNQHQEGIREGLKAQYAARVPLHELDTRQFSHLLFALKVDGFNGIPGSVLKAGVDTVDLSPVGVVEAAYHRIDFLTQATRYLLDTVEGLQKEVEELKATPKPRVDKNWKSRVGNLQEALDEIDTPKVRVPGSFKEEMVDNPAPGTPVDLGYPDKLGDYPHRTQDTLLSASDAFVEALNLSVRPVIDPNYQGQIGYLPPEPLEEATVPSPVAEAPPGWELPNNLPEGIVEALKMNQVNQKFVNVVEKAHSGLLGQSSPMAKMFDEVVGNSIHDEPLHHNKTEVVSIQIPPSLQGLKEGLQETMFPTIAPKLD